MDHYPPVSSRIADTPASIRLLLLSHTAPLPLAAGSLGLHMGPSMVPREKRPFSAPATDRALCRSGSSATLLFRSSMPARGSLKESFPSHCSGDSTGKHSHQRA